MTENTYVVIMAGGGGTRLWPLSRQSRPKQLLRLTGDRSFFRIAVDRLDGLIPPERILVVTTAEQARLLQAEAPEIPPENYLAEPMPRGTASVVGLAAVALKHKNPEACMIVLTADHIINNVQRFTDLLQFGVQVARKGFLVTLGIEPTFPATGYGYIQAGELVGETGGYKAFQALKFKEKPDQQTAQTFILEGKHFWNSGMFMWRVDRILAEFKHWMPEQYAALMKIATDWGNSNQNETLQKIWPTIQTQTIDFGIMEKAEKVAVIPASELGWSDVGSWDSLFEILPANENGNIILADSVMEINAGDNLVVSEQKKRLVTLIGVENLVIVDTPDALLICKRDDAQQVKLAVNQLKQSNHPEYL